MTLTEHGSTAENITIFRPKIIYQLLKLLPLFIGVICPVSYWGYANTNDIKISWFEDGENGQALLAFIIFMALAMFDWVLSYYLFRTIDRGKLAISPGGLAYKGNDGLVMRAAWDDIIGSSLTQQGILKVAVLIAKDNRTKVNLSSRNIKKNPLVFSVPGSSSRPEYLLMIPLGFFSNDWQNDKIGRLIRQYCPALLEKVNATAKSETLAFFDIPSPAGALPEPPGQAVFKPAKNPAGIILGICLVLISLLLVVAGFVVNSGREEVVKGYATQTSSAWREARNLTASVNKGEYILNYAQGLPVVQPPTSGDLPFENNKQTFSPATGLKFQSFFATALLTNPFDKATGAWSYGFDVFTADGPAYRIYITSESTLEVVQIDGTGSAGKETSLFSGKDSIINTAAGGTNTVAVCDQSGILYVLVNDRNLATVPLYAGKGGYDVKLVYEPGGNFSSEQPALHYQQYSIRGTKS